VLAVAALIITVVMELIDSVVAVEVLVVTLNMVALAATVS
jgi:hypothetical protein